MITSEEVDAIAETMPGAVHHTVKLGPTEKEKKANSPEQALSTINQVPRMSFASIGQDGKVKIETAKDIKA